MTQHRWFYPVFLFSAIVLPIGLTTSRSDAQILMVQAFNPPPGSGVPGSSAGGGSRFVQSGCLQEC